MDFQTNPNNVVSCIRSAYTHTGTCHYDIIDPMARSDVGWSEHSRFLPAPSLPLSLSPYTRLCRPFCNPLRSPFQRISALNPWETWCPFQFLRRLWDKDSREFEASNDSEVRELHHTSAFSHMMEDGAFLMLAMRCRNYPLGCLIWKLFGSVVRTRRTRIGLAMIFFRGG